MSQFVTRKDAAKHLGVSTKTIDRYTSSGKLGYQKQDNIVLIPLDDIQKLTASKTGAIHFETYPIQNSTNKDSKEEEETNQKSENQETQTSVTTNDGKTQIPIQNKSKKAQKKAYEEQYNSANTFGATQTQNPANEDQEKTSKKETDLSRGEYYFELIDDMRKELKEKNTRLEAANYKIGELEAQLQSRVPMLEYRKKDEEINELKVQMQQNKNEKQAEVSRLRMLLQKEQMNKYIFAGLIFFIGILGLILFIQYAI